MLLIHKYSGLRVESNVGDENAKDHMRAAMSGMACEECVTIRSSNHGCGEVSCGVLELIREI